MREKILALRESGLSLRDIERQIGVNRGTISYMLDSNMRDRKRITRLERRHKLKIQCISYKGGRCVCCSFNLFKSALEFHHLDTKVKEIDIAVAFARNYSFERIKTELDKCILVCANCHRGIHSGEVILPS